MGYGRELLADGEFERDYPFGIPGGYWKTRDGRRWQITEMTNSHIRNCMKMVGEDNKWHDVFEKELQRRRMYAEDEDGEVGYGNQANGTRELTRICAG